MAVRFGPQLCGSLSESSAREWLLTDGLGGFAMGTAAGLRTRRYHGLLVVATQPPGQRRLALASLDPVLLTGGERIRLFTHEWASGAVDPAGYALLTSFELRDTVPVWTFRAGESLLEVSLAMARGRSAVGVRYRLLAGPEPVGLEVSALCTWRDVNGDREGDGEPDFDCDGAGFSFEGAFRVEGPGFQPLGEWYRGVRYRVEAERGLNDREDLFCAGHFAGELSRSEPFEVTAWAGPAGERPPPAGEIISAARRRAVSLRGAGGEAAPEGALRLAADQFVVEAPGGSGPTVVAGYPWFGDWSRDTMVSYEGLFLSTGRVEEGRHLLRAAAGSLSQGMLANTGDILGSEFNTIDATLWFLHAVRRHVEETGDLELAAELMGALDGVVAAHLAGTRFSIRVDPVDGLVTGGATGVALTWMDARVGGDPVTPRMGKPVEVNALWVSGLFGIAALKTRLGADDSTVRSLAERAKASFARRFARPGGGLFDVVDGPAGDDPSLRPNQLLAVSLPDAPLADAGVVRACAPLLTPLGLRSLSPFDPAYRPFHRGGPAARDLAYHEGTVWPWLIGPYVDASRRLGLSTEHLLDALVDHLGDDGLGSVSETADGSPPHGASGCPFQAWSVAELLRSLRAG